MEHTYQLQTPIHQRQSQSTAIGPAPPASMIDPAFETDRLQNAQLPHGFAYSQSQTNPTVMNTHPSPSSTQDNSPDRALPSIEIADHSIDQAYVDFILYCNPAVPADTDPTELKKGFRAPPMSDGKKFNPFTLYGLIGKLESKEIKTWAQLVVELGVELPDPTKNQSAQKVQQYAVRLKVLPSSPFSTTGFCSPAHLLLTTAANDLAAVAPCLPYRCILPLLPGYPKRLLHR